MYQIKVQNVKVDHPMLIFYRALIYNVMIIWTFFIYLYYDIFVMCGLFNILILGIHKLKLKILVICIIIWVYVLLYGFCSTH
jgi:hypothetical protein